MSGEDRNSIVTRLFKSGAAIFTGQVFELLVSFLSALVVARYLGPTGFGAVSIGVTVVNTSLSFILFGLPNGVARYLPRYDMLRERRGVIISAFQITLPVGIAVAGVIFVAAEPISTIVLQDHDLVPVLRVFAIAIPFAVARDLSLGVMKGLQQSLPTVLVRNVVFPGSRFIVAIPAVLFSLTTVQIAWVYVIPFILTGALAAMILFRNFPLLDGDDYSSMRMELLVFSLPLMISGAMARVLRDLDTFLLSYFSETASVGVYNVVYPLAMLPLFVLTSFEYLFMPVISELQSENRLEDVGRLYRLVTKWVFVGTLPILLPIAIFSETIIKLTFGPEFVSGGLALSILSTGYAFSALAGPNSSLLTSLGRTKLVMYDNVVAAILNLIVNLLLIPRFGIVGAAIATVSSYVVMNILFSYQAYRDTGIHPVSTAILKPALSAFILMGAVHLLVNTIWDPRLLSIIIIYVAFIGVYILSLLLLGAIEQEDIMIVLQFEDRFDMDLGLLKKIASRVMKDPSEK